MIKNWGSWETNMQKSTNSRMLQQLAFDTQQNIKTTNTQDLDPLPLSNKDHTSVLSFEIHSSQVNHHLVPWIGTPWDFSVILSVIPTTIGSLFHFGRSGFDLLSVCQFRISLDPHSQRCSCNVFHYDPFGDHLQACRVKSAYSQVHDWVVYRLGGILGSVGHKVKIHKIKSVTGKGRGDLEMKDYVFF